MGALRLEPVQFHLIFDGSIRVVGDRFSLNLSNKSSSVYQDKSRRYQTLLNAVYSKSILGSSVQDIFVNSFANGSLIVFFRITLDRKKIPKPISSIEETLKNVIFQEASSPLSVLNALRIDLKEFHIKRYLTDPRQHTPKDELTTVIAPIEQPKREYDGIVETPRPSNNGSHWPAVTSAATRNRTVPSQMVHSSSVAESNNPGVIKNNLTEKEAKITTPSMTVQSHQTTKPTAARPTEPSDFYLGMTKQFIQSGVTSEEQFLSNPITQLPSTTRKSIAYPSQVRTAEISTTTTSNLHYSDEPWKPLIPDEVRRLAGKVDFDYGVGEAEVILDTLAADMSATPQTTTLPRMKIRPFRTAGVVEEVKMTLSPFEFKTTHAYSAERVEKPNTITLINEQKSMPELSILQQFHDLDSLLRSYVQSSNAKLKQPTAKPANEDHPVEKKPFDIVTLLPVRSNVGIRGPVRPRPKEELSRATMTTNAEAIQATLATMTSATAEFHASVNQKYPTTTETVETKAPEGRSNTTQQMFFSVDSDMVAIPLQKYFALTSPTSKTDGIQSQTLPHVERKPAESRDDISYVTEGVRAIAIVGKEDVDVSSQRNLRMGLSRDRDKASSRKTQSLDQEETYINSRSNHRVARNVGQLDQEMRLLLEEIFFNLTTTARTVNGINRTDVRRTPQTIDFNYPHSVQSQSFNIDNTGVLNKLAKLKIASQLDDRNISHPKGSNKNIVSSFSSNGAPFRILTKVYNKIPAKPEQQNTTEPTLIETSGCPGNLSILCGSGECLPKHLRCNKLMECRDGSDETNCTCADFLNNRFNQNKICDGIYDCWDLSDEQNCEWCSPGQHICSNSKMCIDSFQVCDGFPHCPLGDDEKNCVTISPSVEEAAEKYYFSQGYVMVRKEGLWGKMCFQNFDNVISQSKTEWSIEDLGQSVCKTLTFQKFEGIVRRKDVKKLNHDSDASGTGRGIMPVTHGPSNPPVYFELALTAESNTSTAFGNRRAASREKFLFQKTSCVEKEVAEIKCSGLGCGVRPEANLPWTTDRRSRIVGGGNAGPGAWPWLAALYKEGEFQCGATLISDVWLMSAGHCFYNAQREYWVARLGALRRGTPPAPYEQLRPISLIILHPDYQDQGFINDISLLRMVRPISLTTYVRPICLPPSTREPKDGSMCTVVGWGQLHEVARVFPDTLQEVQLPVISTVECRKRTVFLPLYQVTDNMFCAGYERGGRDACLGDSGGPFMCQENDGSWTLAGVTSNGYGCARANRPGVYTKVVNYLPWAQEVMRTSGSKGPDHGPPACQGHRCPLGECLPPARLCNGYIECRDSSDERGCW